MSIVLFDTNNRKKLYPFTYNHAIADIRMGIFTFREWWQQTTAQEVYVSTAAYLQPLYKQIPEGEHIWIESSVIADKELSEKIMSLKSGEALEDEEGIVAVRTNEETFSMKDDKTEDAGYTIQNASHRKSYIVNRTSLVRRLNFPWQIFQWNDEAIREDFEIITKGRTSAKVSATNTVIGNGQLFIEEGAEVEHAFLNTATGPIYIGKHAVVMENSMIRGPFAMLSNAVVKMGAKIYGATTLGPCCVTGGEIKNAVMQGYSNKAHDGYLGDSVIGEWCNLGAGTSNSNVKNTGGNVKIWNPDAEVLTEVGQKCGLIMGDYSRTAINTSVNTGSFIGLCCNVFGEGFPPKVMNNFIWGGKGLSKYEFEKALSDIANWKRMKFAELTPEEIAVLKYIFEETEL